MLKLTRVIFLTGMILATALPLAAQSQSSQHKYQVTPYFWMAGFDGDVGAEGRTAHVDQSFGDIWSNLQFGAMGTFEGRWDRWVFLGDVMYLNLQDEESIPNVPVFTTATVKSKMLIVDPEFGYQIFRRDGSEVNLLAGGRYWHLKNELALSGGGGGTLGVTETKDWIDPIVGLQFRHDVSKSVFVSSKADIGGFSVAARLDWQFFGGVGFRFNDRVAGIVGYRHLSVDYSNDGFLFDTTMKGIVAGVGIGF
jgi:hypothetical protein